MCELTTFGTIIECLFAGLIPMLIFAYMSKRAEAQELKDRVYLLESELRLFGFGPRTKSIGGNKDEPR